MTNYVKLCSCNACIPISCIIFSLSQYAQTSLMLASENGHEDIVRILLAAHARVNQQNEVISITPTLLSKTALYYFSPGHGVV